MALLGIISLGFGCLAIFFLILALALRARRVHRQRCCPTEARVVHTDCLPPGVNDPRVYPDSSFPPYPVYSPNQAYPYPQQYVAQDHLYPPPPVNPVPSYDTVAPVEKIPC